MAAEPESCKLRATFMTLEDMHRTLKAEIEGPGRVQIRVIEGMRVATNTDADHPASRTAVRCVKVLQAILDVLVDDVKVTDLEKVRDIRQAPACFQVVGLQLFSELWRTSSGCPTWTWGYNETYKKQVVTFRYERSGIRVSVDNKAFTRFPNFCYGYGPTYVAMNELEDSDMKALMAAFFYLKSTTPADFEPCIPAFKWLYRC